MEQRRGTKPKVNSHMLAKPIASTAEFERSLLLLDRLVGETYLWLERTSSERLDWLPIDNPNVKFGDRLIVSEGAR
jgi:hypothetical protein